ncbi:MAG: hypothetical protein WA366_01330 [Pseudolabrys sp.]
MTRSILLVGAALISVSISPLNAEAFTEPEARPSTQPLATPDPVPKKEPTTIGGRTEGSASDQLSETSDPVLKKAKITVAAKMEDPASVEFVDIERAVKKIGQSFEIICGHVKGKKNLGEATGERPFLYLVKEDEAFIVGGNRDSMAAIAYRAHCISANSPAPAPDVTPEPKLDAVAATPAPAPDVTPEPKLGAAPKAQSAPDVLRKVEPAAGPARAEAPPKKKRVTATGPTGAAGAITGRERARPPERDFGQSAGELPPQ